VLPVALFGVIATVSVSLVLFLKETPLRYDAVGYNRLAISIKDDLRYSYDESSPPTAYYPPLYPAFVALIYKLVGEQYKAIYLAQAILHGLTAAGVFYIARALSLSSFLAAMAALLTGFYPGLIGATRFVIVEPLHTFLIISGVLVSTLVLKRPSLFLAALAGFMWGLSALCKPVTFGVPFAIVALFLVPGKKEQGSLLAHSLMLLLFFVLTLAPWTIRNLLLFDRPVLVSTNTGVNFYLGTLRPLTFDANDIRVRPVIEEAKTKGFNEAETDGLFAQKAIDNIVADPTAFLKRVMENSVMLWAMPVVWQGYAKDAPFLTKPSFTVDSYGLHKGLVLLGLFGLSMAAIIRDAKFLVIAIPILWFTVVYSVTFVQTRFNLPGMPLLVLGGVYFLDALQAQMRPALLRAVVVLLALWSPLVLFTTYMPPSSVESLHPYSNGINRTWTIVNPDENAPNSRIHFIRMDLGSGDKLELYDMWGELHQVMAAGQLEDGGWSDVVPGRVIAVNLISDDTNAGWGFKIDRIVTVNGE
ncbi:MAG: glycosyl transferase family 39, partial [Dehalococcoidia bacterium]|nr:glycosyl transferase family 39 [Dehalococcoidia bacterium]